MVEQSILYIVKVNMSGHTVTVIYIYIHDFITISHLSEIITRIK